MKYYHI